MHYRRRVDLRNSFEYALPQLLPGSHSHPAKERSRHLPEQGFHQVQPRSMGGGMHITKAIGPSGQIGAGLLGNVGRMIVQNQSDHRLGGVMSVQILEQGNKLAAAVAPLDTRCYMTILRVQSCQNGSR